MEYTNINLAESSYACVPFTTGVCVMESAHILRSTNRALNPDISTSIGTSLNANAFQANLKKQANLFRIIDYEVVTAATDLQL